MKNTNKCPSCGQQIYRYAQVCPYCKCETHFKSVDEEQAQEQENNIPVEEEHIDKVADNAQDMVPEADVETNNEDQSGNHDGDGHLNKYIGHLKKDTEKVKDEYKKKIGSKYSSSTILIGFVIALLSIIVLCFYIAVQMMEKKTFSLSGSVDNTMKEVIDSVEGKLYQSSTIVAKFPDRQRHCLFYLQDSHLRIFDAEDKSDKEIDLPALNPKAIVDFNGSGVLNAYLSADKNYIIVVASRNSSNTEFGLYRLDSNPANPILEFLDKGRVSLEKDRYVVSAGSRVATYDINGNKMSGLSSTEFENMPQPKVEAPVRQEVKKKEPIPDLPPREKVTEQIRPTIDLAPKTKVEVPERPNIKPVDVPTSGK